MLSLEKAASGSTLIEATHIILMGTLQPILADASDAVTGTAEEAKAIEAQAIGRACRQGQTKQITVVRFMMWGTTEHDQYVRNYLKSDDSQLIARQKGMLMTISETWQIWELCWMQFLMRTQPILLWRIRRDWQDTL